MNKKPTKLEELNRAIRPYGLQCYTWSPGDGVTRYRFSVDLDSDYSACSVMVTVLGAKQAELVATAWIQGYEAGCRVCSATLSAALGYKKED